MENNQIQLNKQDDNQAMFDTMKNLLNSKVEAEFIDADGKIEYNGNKLDSMKWLFQKSYVSSAFYNLEKALLNTNGDYVAQDIVFTIRETIMSLNNIKKMFSAQKHSPMSQILSQLMDLREKVHNNIDVDTELTQGDHKAIFQTLDLLFNSEVESKYMDIDDKIEFNGIKFDSIKQLFRYNKVGVQREFYELEDTLLNKNGKSSNEEVVEQITNTLKSLSVVDRMFSGHENHPMSKIFLQLNNLRADVNKKIAMNNSDTKPLQGNNKENQLAQQKQEMEMFNNQQSVALAQFQAQQKAAMEKFLEAQQQEKQAMQNKYEK